MMIMEAFPFAVDIFVAETKQGAIFFSHSSTTTAILFKSPGIKVVSDWFKSFNSRSSSTVREFHSHENKVEHNRGQTAFK